MRNITVMVLVAFVYRIHPHCLKCIFRMTNSRKKFKKLHSAGSVVRQSKEYIPYQPGKSKLIFLSGVLSTTNPLPSNITTRIGHFDSAIDKTAESNPIGNGHFFEMVGGTVPVVNVVERSFFNSGLGWGTETRIQQSAWNMDTLNGVGGPGNPSGININFYLDNVFVIDMQWLGVGQVRMGIVALIFKY